MRARERRLFEAMKRELGDGGRTWSWASESGGLRVCWWCVCGCSLCTSSAERVEEGEEDCDAPPSRQHPEGKIAE